jgi:hypothetical protein
MKAYHNIHDVTLHQNLQLVSPCRQAIDERNKKSKGGQVKIYVGVSHIPYGQCLFFA